MVRVLSPRDLDGVPGKDLVSETGIWAESWWRPRRERSEQRKLDVEKLARTFQTVGIGE